MDSAPAPDKSLGIDHKKCEPRMWILDTGCGHDLVQGDTLPKASRVQIERARSARKLHTANGTSQATMVAPLQVDYFMENIEPYVLPSTPNVLSSGRRCRHDGYEFSWKPFAKTPELIAPDGTVVPVEVFGIFLTFGIL